MIQAYGASAFCEYSRGIPSLPALRELTIGIYSGTFCLSEDILSAFISLPNLQRSNLEWLRVAIIPRLLGQVVNLAPNLTHLRLPTVSPFEMSWDSGVLPPLSSTFKTILVQLPPPQCPDFDYQGALLALEDDCVVQLRPSYLEWS